MPKLFVAVPIPAASAARLAAIQPQPHPGIRWSAPGQMHLTLHYLGEMDEQRAERMSRALAEVNARPCPLTLAGVGWFPPAKDASTLYVGVRQSDALTELHALIAQALVPEGFRAEQRPYTPHVTLARCSTDVPAAVIEQFLEKHRALELEPIMVQTFGLYSTAWQKTASQEDVPRYQLERSFALRD